KDKIQDAKDVDRYISAELPDPKTDPEGYRVVSEMMVHGPCGPADPTASCMKENLCSKKFWYERIFKSKTKKKAKTKQNQARNRNDKVKGQPSEENTT
ncbi:hypothetical protein Tco_0406109, partial [Tanacetum coccineum]